MLNVFIILLFIKYLILLASCVKISEQYLKQYANYSLFNLKGSKSKVTKIEIKLKDKGTNQTVHFIHIFSCVMLDIKNVIL